MAETSLKFLLDACENTWVPRWFREFSNPEGGFFERLDSVGQPISLPRRVLTQCRQIMVYATYVTRHPDALMVEKLKESFAFLNTIYRSPHVGGFYFSHDDSRQTQDSTYDLYAHSFVMLACAAYYKAFGDPNALIIAQNTRDFITRHFRAPQPFCGFVEALDQDLTPLPRTRRQNPHMHLMEACLVMYETSEDMAYLDLADELFGLLTSYFLVDGTLREFFADDLTPHPDTGHTVEAGHHAEWVWLLDRYHSLKGHKDSAFNTAITTLKDTLFTWVAAHSFDPVNGGIWNSQTPSGTPVDTNKRIWPVFETLRAAAVMLAQDPENRTAKSVFTHAQHLVSVYVAADGTWTEMRDTALDIAPNVTLAPTSRDRPGTTPYHIYLPLLESVERYGAY